MAQLGMPFDSTQVDPVKGFDLLPPADYKVQVIDSDVRSTKDGQGKYIWVEMEVLAGEHANRKLWHNFNIINGSEKAQQIGQGQLSSLCHAIGVGVMEDTEELHFKPFVISVGVQPAKDGYDAQNRVKSFKASGGGGGGIASQRGQGARPGGGNGQAGGGGGRGAQTRSGGPQGGGTGGGTRPWQQARKPVAHDPETGEVTDDLRDEIPF